ncbi:hypothetical protein [Pedobacter nototheniae]|uniref:hypothetical protein n=1 Tax=Pedobacter nototheniae TaxID=2488994 RepID=UPI00292E25D7|nr:hypothetical protein [Pedobacter nototheniae]
MAFNLFKKKKAEPVTNAAIDFSSIDSQEKAVQLYVGKQLVKLYLMPLAFGGEDNPLNVLYVPAFVNFYKDRFDIMIENLLLEGKELNYSAVPEYKGNSFIPGSLLISVSGDAKFQETINIW